MTTTSTRPRNLTPAPRKPGPAPAKLEECKKWLTEHLNAQSGRRRGYSARKPMKRWFLG